MDKLDLKTLNGTVVCVPVCNPLAYGNSIRVKKIDNLLIYF